MDHLFKLINTVKHYDWGSPRWIPDLLGRENARGEPWAELWMGIHPEGPSIAETPGGRVRLAELIADQFPESAPLPFLFKVLAAAKPLSIQAHPNREQAERGWDRENRAGLSPKAPERNYKDPNHKPEIICALSPFKAVCGFREIGEIRRLFGLLFQKAPVSLGAVLQRLSPAPERAAPEALRGFIKALFSLSPEERRLLSDRVKDEWEALAERFPEYADEWKTAGRFAELYPGDSGIIAPLYLNLLNLRPGEAIFLPAGVLHAYIEGFGVELMANSDNVLRGGLTAKHIDIEELTAILRFTPYHPAILKPPEPGPPCFAYPSGYREFSLSSLRSEGPAARFPRTGSHILLVTRGRADLRYRTGEDKPQEEKLVLQRGESAFVFLEESAELSLSGDFSLYAAGGEWEGADPP